MKAEPVIAMLTLVLLFFTNPVFTQASGVPEAPTRSSDPFDSLFIKATQLRTALKFDSAAMLFQKIAPKYRDRKQWEQYLDCQAHIAFCLWITHRGDQAVELSKQMIEEGTGLLGSDHVQLAKLYTVLGNVYADRRSKEDYDRCITYYEKALELTRNHYGEQHPAVAAAYERLGIARYLIDDYVGAIPFYEKALSMLDAPDPENAGTYYSFHANLGLNYFGMGHFTQALENFRKGKYYLREVLGQEDGRMVKVSINIAEALIQLGDAEEALITLEEVRTLEAENVEPTSKLKAYYRGSIAECYQAKEQYREAIANFQQCLPYWDPNNRDDANGLILEHSRIGACYLELRQVDSALDHFEQALVFLENYYDKDNYNWVEPLTNLGRAWQLKGDSKLAETYYLEALSVAIGKMGEHHPAVGKIQTELSRLFLQKGKLGKAYRWALLAQKAFLKNERAFQNVPTIDEVSDLMAYVEVLDLSGTIKTRQFVQSENIADLQEARLAFRNSLACSDSLKFGLQSGSAMQKAQRQVHGLAERALDCLFLLWQWTCDEKYLEEALVYFEKSKSNWLRTSAREWLARQYAGIPDTIVEQELRLKAQLVYYRNLIKSQWTGGRKKDSYKTVVWQDRFFQARQQLDALIYRLEKEYPEYYQMKYDYQVASLGTIKSYTQENNAQLVTYFWGKDKLYALSVAAGSVQWIKISELHCVESRLEAFQEAIHAEKNGWRSDISRLSGFQSFVNSGFELYADLLQPLIGQENYRRLILIPDGPLGELPFQILPSASPEGFSLKQVNYRNLPYLIRCFPIQYEHSATLLVQQNARVINQQEYLGFAPSYRDGSILTAFTRGKTMNGTGMDPLREGWGQLTYTRQEVEEIAAKTGGKKMVGKAATEQAFKQMAVNAGILHLAGHAFSHESEPDYSALIFSKDPARPQDGQLYAYELYNLPLLAELAVLSACNTGAGVFRQGEGVMSLSRAFQYAGCPSVMMSLWPANDATTKSIVVNFFENLNSRSSKSKALQNASIDFLSTVKSDRLTHPFYWGNFVLVGQDDPIEFRVDETSGNAWITWVAGTVLLLLAGIGWHKKNYSGSASRIA